jgi:hypothetical protein
MADKKSRMTKVTRERFAEVAAMLRALALTSRRGGRSAARADILDSSFSVAAEVYDASAQAVEEAVRECWPDYKPTDEEAPKDVFCTCGIHDKACPVDLREGWRHKSFCPHHPAGSR